MANGIGSGGGSGIDTKLRQNMEHMIFDRALTDREFFRDVSIGSAVHEQVEYIEFTGGEQARWLISGSW